MIDQEKILPLDKGITENEKYLLKHIREREDGNARYEFRQPEGNREIWYETYDSWDYALNGSKLPYHGVVITLTEKHLADEKWPYRKGEFFRLHRMRVTQKDFFSGERKVTVTVPGRWRNSKTAHSDINYSKDGKKLVEDSTYSFAKTDLTPFIPKSTDLPEEIDSAATIRQFLKQIAAFDFSDPELILPHPTNSGQIFPSV